MNLNIRTTQDLEEVADFIALSINKQLGEGRRVLWFVTGGSSIPIETKVASRIKAEHKGELVITLTDERFGEIGHIDSNWYQLYKNGFDIPNAKLIPFLSGKNFLDTTLYLREVLKEEIKKAEYQIGIFGIGIDGHTAGILPYSEAVSSTELVSNFETPQFNRITITPKVILQLDEAIVCVMGEQKWPILDKLMIESPIEEVPSLLLKKVPLLTIFTDKKV